MLINNINNINNNNNGDRNIFEIFEDNFQKITTETAMKLNDLIDDYKEPKVKWALQAAIDNNARNLRYVEKTLENDRNGISKNDTNTRNIKSSKTGEQLTRELEEFTNDR